MSSQPRLDFEGYVAPRPLPESPVGRRDVGKAIAGSNNSHQRGAARELALEYLGAHGVGIVSDVRAFAKKKGVELEWSKPWTGSLFQHPWFAPTGERRMATHARGNARKVNEYRLSPEGWSALKEMRRG